MSGLASSFAARFLLPLGLVLCTAAPGHAIKISLFESRETNVIGREELLTDALKTLEGAQRVANTMSSRALAKTNSEGVNQVNEMARSSGTFFGMFVRRYFEESIESRSFDATTLDEVSYNYMKTASLLPMQAQRLLINAMRDEVKVVKFPKYGSTVASENKRGLWKMNLIYKGILTAGLVTAIAYNPIFFDRHLEVWNYVAGVYLAPEVLYGTFKLGSYMRRILRRTLTADHIKQLHQAELRAGDFKTAALPADCSMVLMSEITEAQVAGKIAEAEEIPVTSEATEAEMTQEAARDIQREFEASQGHAPAAARKTKPKTSGPADGGPLL